MLSSGSLAPPPLPPPLSSPLFLLYSLSLSPPFLPLEPPRGYSSPSHTSTFSLSLTHSISLLPPPSLSLSPALPISIPTSLSPSPPSSPPPFPLLDPRFAQSPTLRTSRRRRERGPCPVAHAHGARLRELSSFRILSGATPLGIPHPSREPRHGIVHVPAASGSCRLCVSRAVRRRAQHPSRESCIWQLHGIVDILYHTILNVM